MGKEGQLAAEEETKDGRAEERSTTSGRRTKRRRRRARERAKPRGTSGRRGLLLMRPPPHPLARRLKVKVERRRQRRSDSRASEQLRPPFPPPSLASPSPRPPQELARWSPLWRCFSRSCAVSERRGRRLSAALERARLLLQPLLLSGCQRPLTTPAAAAPPPTLCGGTDRGLLLAPLAAQPGLPSYPPPPPFPCPPGCYWALRRRRRQLRLMRPPPPSLPLPPSLWKPRRGLWGASRAQPPSTASPLTMDRATATEGLTQRATTSVTTNTGQRSARIQAESLPCRILRAPSARMYA